jgi:hypothetical protein
MLSGRFHLAPGTTLRVNPGIVQRQAHGPDKGLRARPHEFALPTHNAFDKIVETVGTYKIIESDLGHGWFGLPALVDVHVLAFDSYLSGRDTLHEMLMSLRKSERTHCLPSG